jgi:ubiquinone/menaquinone biosynthesis C-methylase UbiE
LQVPRPATPAAAASTGQAINTPQQQSVQQDSRPTSDPYTGDLSIFESKDRDKRLQINRVMDLLGIVTGAQVADVGAGSGWFTVRASARVGPKGKVFAEDINPEAAAYIRNRVTSSRLNNVQVILGSPDDPRLPASTIDAVLIMKTYHEIAHPSAFLAHLRPALKSDARVGVIDRNGDGTNHGLQSSVLVQEMAHAGFRLTGSYDFTKADGQDYFLIFQVRPE